MQAQKKRLSAFALSAVLLGSSAVTLAQDQSPPSTAAAPVSAIQWLTIKQVYDKLEAAGYKEITEIERDHGRYEVKATHADGQRLKLYVDPQTGSVIDSKTKHHRN